MREKPIHLAAKLKTIRQRLGLSQTEMKKRLKFSGHYGRISDTNLEDERQASQRFCGMREPLESCWRKLLTMNLN